MFFRISRQMAAKNGTEVPMKKGHQSSIERQVEIPRRRLSGVSVTHPSVEPRKKIAHFGLSDDPSSS